MYTVSPLVLVGTREPDGGFDLAPKHRILPLPSHVGFVCRPSHATWRNALREGAFTMSWPSPRQIVMAAAAASKVEGVLLEGGRLHLECTLERVLDDLGEEGVVLGRIVAAHADPKALRRDGLDDGVLVYDQAPIAYLPIGEGDAHPLVRGEGLVEHLDGGDLGAEDRGQPVGREVVRVGGNRDFGSRALGGHAAAFYTRSARQGTSTLDAR